MWRTSAASRPYPSATRGPSWTHARLSLIGAGSSPRPRPRGAPTTASARTPRPCSPRSRKRYRLGGDSSALRAA
eukprot:697855-Lingulodinium_polyedra.AAC.1